MTAFFITDAEILSIRLLLIRVYNRDDWAQQLILDCDGFKGKVVDDFIEEACIVVCDEIHMGPPRYFRVREVWDNTIHEVEVLLRWARDIC